MVEFDGVDYATLIKLFIDNTDEDGICRVEGFDSMQDTWVEIKCNLMTMIKIHITNRGLNPIYEYRPISL